MAKKVGPTKIKKYLPYLLGGSAVILVISLGIALGRGGTGQAAQPTENQAEPIFPPARIDKPAPDLTLEALDGSQVSLRDFKGKVVLVNNWATWCPPCRAEMPELNSYYQEHVDQGFLVVAIEAGSPQENVQSFVDSTGIDFPVLLDPKTESLKGFQNASLPNSFVIDREGQLRLTWTGAINEATLEEHVNPLLEE